ncbi:MAG: hypothetical protein H6741_12750 [Alphaproteobacteria bacterium]|nr:hypothetical protein [Alphaproteobacteria bacterium]
MTSVILLSGRGSAPRDALPEAILLPGATEPLVPYCGVRVLLRALADHGLEAQVLEAMRARRATLSLLFSGLGPLSPEEQATRDAISPNPAGYMSHNSMVARPLLVDLMEMIEALVAGRRLALLDPAGWDGISLSLLLHAAQQAEGAQLVVQAQPLEPPRAGPHRTRLLRVLAWTDRLARFEQVTQVEGALPTPPRVPPVAPLDDAAELEALARDLPPEQALAAVAQAFARGGFRCAQVLGERLLERAGDALSEAGRREAHRLVALSAYNLQVQTSTGDADADLALAELLDRHFRAAMQGETDPAWRAHLLYRLCINEGRRFNRVDEALALADEAVAVARDADLPVQEAWARNGRAYLRARKRDAAGALEDCLAAERLLSEPVQGSLEGERLASWIVMRDNLVELHSRLRQWDEAERWEGLKVELTAALPGDLLPEHRWLAIYRAQGRLDRAVEVAEALLRGARDLHLPELEDVSRAELAELRYRQGRAGASLLDAVAALASGERLFSEEIVQGARMSAAMAALRAQDARAVELLSEALEQADGDAATAELLAVLGVAHAQLGAEEEAERHVNDAIEIASDLGAADTLTRVACAAGEASLALGRPEQAAEAFAQACALSEDGLTGPADRLIALSGHLATGGGGEALDEALDLLERALAEPEVWWELERLQAACARHGRAAPPVLRAALAQRGA